MDRWCDTDNELLAVGLTADDSDNENNLVWSAWSALSRLVLMLPARWLVDRVAPSPLLSAL